MTTPMKEELLEAWKSTFKACNYVVIFILFAAIHHGMDEWGLPLIFGSVETNGVISPLRKWITVMSWVGFTAVYARLVFHMVVAFYPSLDIVFIPGQKPAADK